MVADTGSPWPPRWVVSSFGSVSSIRSLGIALIQKSPSAPQRGAAVRALQEVTATGGYGSSPIRGTESSSPERGIPANAEGPLARALGFVVMRPALRQERHRSRHGDRGG